MYGENTKTIAIPIYKVLLYLVPCDTTVPCDSVLYELVSQVYIIVQLLDKQYACPESLSSCAKKGRRSSTAIARYVFTGRAAKSVKCQGFHDLRRVSGWGQYSPVKNMSPLKFL